MTHKLIRLLIVFLFTMLLSPFSIQAETYTKTYELDEGQEDFEFIIEGEQNNFDVRMILPNGTKVNFDNFDYNEFIYFSMPNKRIWAVKNAPAGTYTFEIVGASEDTFSIDGEGAIDRPKVNWSSPKEGSISVRNDEPILLTWEASGDFQYNYDIRFILKQDGGSHEFVVQEANADDGEIEIVLPETIPSGKYLLFIEAENTKVQPQRIDPKVVIEYTNDRYDMEPVEIVEQFIQNGILYVNVKVPKGIYFDYFEAQIDGESLESPQIATGIEEDFILLEETDEYEIWNWSVVQLEDGSYSGNMIVVEDEDEFSPILEIAPFEIKRTDFTEDMVEWSIMEEETNATSLDITVRFPIGTEVEVLIDEKMVLTKVIEEEEEVLTVGLEEGFPYILVRATDEHQNSQSYTKQYKVDHTPPQLEMIQPLPTNEMLNDDFASGYVELGSKLIVNGKEVEYDEDGYFLVENIGDELNIEVYDSLGNKAEYYWEAEIKSASFAWLWIVLINIMIVGGTGFTIWRLKK
ncbi:hypothetical protein [Gracilibacillus dipsosauri]|uniref:hypothetical protein n=1 Tax=Gracilibacillus dipsosauri TaxID=178340 RepID=UPI00240A91E0